MNFTSEGKTYKPTKGMFPDAKPGEAGYWMNQGEVEGGYGVFHWAIGEDGMAYMVLCWEDLDRMVEVARPS